LVGPHVGAVLGVSIFHLVLKKGSADSSELASSVTASSIDSRQWRHFTTYPPNEDHQEHYKESHNNRDYNMNTL
jgi:hypothetical protein